MERIVKELQEIIRFKDTTEEGDVILMAIENPQTIMYGVVTEITRDPSKKDEWYHLTIKILGVPIQEVVWTLRPTQFSGLEIFTMGGEKRFVKAIDLGRKTPESDDLPDANRNKIVHLKRVK